MLTRALCEKKEVDTGKNRYKAKNVTRMQKKFKNAKIKWEKIIFFWHMESNLQALVANGLELL
jgi:hypothetical protein